MGGGTFRGKKRIFENVILYVLKSVQLTKIATSTWRASFTRARHVYLAVIRPAITYGSTVWYAPAGTKDARKDMAGKLEIMQNRCLRIVAGAYKATPIEVLQAETMLPPMQVHLDQLQAKARSRLKINGQAAFIRKQCKGDKITEKAPTAKSLPLLPQAAAIAETRSTRKP